MLTDFKNLACSESAPVAQCALLVPHIKNGPSPIFFIFMPKNLSTHCSRRLQIKCKQAFTDLSSPIQMPCALLLRTLIGIPVHGIYILESPFVA